MANKSVNAVVLLGNLTRDAEQKFMGDGTSVATLSVATNRRVKKGEQWEDEAEYHRVTLWRNEGLVPYLTKGKQVCIPAGRLRTSKYEKDGVTHYATDVVANDIILLGGGEKREGGPVSAPRGAKPIPLPVDDDSDSFVPF